MLEILGIVFTPLFIIIAVYDIFWFRRVQKNKTYTSKMGTYTFTPKEKTK